jgi:hypothetical protein
VAPARPRGISAGWTLVAGGLGGSRRATIEHDVTGACVRELALEMSRAAAARFAAAP